MHLWYTFRRKPQIRASETRHERKRHYMANQHDLNKHQIAVKFPHSVWRRIENAATDHKMKPGEYIRWVVSREVESVELTPEDAQLIADRIKDAHAKGRMV